jgi:hypothetical protein
MLHSRFPDKGREAPLMLNLREYEILRFMLLSLNDIVIQQSFLVKFTNLL